VILLPPVWESLDLPTLGLRRSFRPRMPPILLKAFPKRTSRVRFFLKPVALMSIPLPFQRRLSLREFSLPSTYRSFLFPQDNLFSRFFFLLMSHPSCLPSPGRRASRCARQVFFFFLPFTFGSFYRNPCGRWRSSFSPSERTSWKWSPSTGPTPPPLFFPLMLCLLDNPSFSGSV